MPFRMILTYAGYAVGTALHMPWLGTLIGSTIGGWLDAELLGIGVTRPIKLGPRLDDLKIQISTYGVPINKIWGTMRVAGNVIWIKERMGPERIRWPSVFGGIEYKFPPYYNTFAVGICKGPIDRILRIWADGKLIWNLSAENDEVVQIEGLDHNVYLGTETQTADPTIEEWIGAGDVPGFRGLCYAVFRNFPLEKYGNRIPNLNFEIVCDASDSVPHVPIPEVPNSAWGATGLMHSPDNLYVYFQMSGYWYKIDAITGKLVLSADYHLPPQLPYLVNDYDIDENGVIYTQQYASLWKSWFVKLDGDTFEVIQRSEEKSDQTEFYNVVRNPSEPWLYVSKFQSRTVYVLNREMLFYRNEKFREFEGPDHTRLRQMAVDHNTGNCWIVLNEIPLDPPSSGHATYIGHIYQIPGVGHESAYYDKSDDIYSADYICFDPVTNQVILGSCNDGIGEDPAIAFFDGETLELLGKITMPTGSIHFTHSYTSWKRGVVDGYLYLAGGINKIYQIDVAARNLRKTWAATISFIAAGGGLYSPLCHCFFQMIAGETFNAAKILLDRGDTNAVLLSVLVTDICEMAGLTAAEIDVSELTDLVHGYVINSRMTARAALETLMKAYFFDAVESDGKIKFQKRGGAVVVDIPETDLAAHFDGQERPAELTTIRQQESELPLQIDVSYVDQDLNYEVCTQRARRQIVQSENLESLTLPIALDIDEGKQIAEKRLYYEWIQRTRHKFHISGKYDWLDAADVVTINEGGNQHRVRIERIGWSGNLLEIDAANEETSAYVSDAVGPSLEERDGTVDWPGPTKLELIDCPLLRQAFDRIGIFVATQGYTDAWHGALVHRSADEGASWAVWALSVRDAIVGKAATALDDVADPFVWDEGNTVDLRLLDADDSLSNATELQVLNGSNLAILGDEIIQYKTATDQGDGTWRLSGLLRGRKGSDFATGTHAAGDRFILLDEDTISFCLYPLEDMDVERLFRAVSFDMPFDSGTDKLFTCEFRNLMPLSPQHVEGSRDGSNNLTITWIRRGRIAGEWLDNADIPLGETTESYEVDILDTSSAGGGTVKRIINGLTSETATYTAAQQTEDDFTPGDPVTCIIYQMSATVGRGFGEQATV